MRPCIRCDLITGGILIASAILACGRPAQYTGPLATTVDSLFADGAAIACEPIRAPRLPRSPERAVCWRASDTAVVFYLGARTRVVGVLEVWPTDSAGQERAAMARAAVTADYGPAAYVGDDTHGNWVEQWRGDSVCVSLYEGRHDGEEEYQLSRQTREHPFTCRPASGGAA